MASVLVYMQERVNEISPDLLGNLPKYEVFGAPLNGAYSFNGKDHVLVYDNCVVYVTPMPFGSSDEIDMEGRPANDHEENLILSDVGMLYGIADANRKDSKTAAA